MDRMVIMPTRLNETTIGIDKDVRDGLLEYLGPKSWTWDEALAHLVSKAMAYDYIIEHDKVV
jgi:hypothetical protein